MYRTILVALALGAAAVPAAAQTASPISADSNLLALGRKATQWLYAGEADSIFASMSTEAQGSMGGLDGLRQATVEFAMRAGNEVEFIEDRMTLRRGLPQYWREGKFDGFTGEAVVVRWVFDSTGKIVGLGFNPKSRAPAPDAP